MTQLDDIYASLQRSLGPAFAGELDLAEQYAAATCLAAAQAQIDLAAAQDDPTTVTYLVDDLCKDYKVYPPAGSTLEQKRVLLAAAMSYANGCALATVQAGLTAIMGDLYIHARPLTGGDIFAYPGTPSALMPANTPHKLIAFTQTVWKGQQTVAYSRIVDDGNPIIAGEVLDVESGSPALFEQVTVTGAGGTTENPTLTATFTKAHESGKNATTGPRSTWASNSRHWLIVVYGSAFEDAQLMTSANEFLRKTLTSSSTWLFCSTSNDTTIDIMQVGSAVGRNPIGNGSTIQVEV